MTYTSKHLSVPGQRKRNIKRWVIMGLGILFGLFVLGNAGLWVGYRGRVPLNTYVGAIHIGGTSFDRIDTRLAAVLLPEEVMVEYDDQSYTLKPAELGFERDEAAMKQRLLETKRGLPMTWLFNRRTSPLVVRADDEKFVLGVKQVQEAVYKAPEPAHIALADGSFAVVAATPGLQLAVDTLKQSLSSAIEGGKAKVDVVTEPVQAPEPTTNLDAERQKLQKQLGLKFDFRLSGQTKQPGAAEIGTWFVPSGNTMMPSADRIKKYIDTFGVARNSSEAVNAVLYSLSRSRDMTFLLTSSSVPVVYKYCVALKSVDAAHTTDFIQKLAATYGDPRGWNGGANVSFERAESGCDFTAWLSAPSQMTSFGGLCDSYYSCRSGRNVVINFDRWQGATAPWNAAGGGIEDYRVMVINHETGHWLGFGHSGCPGAGQPAPVMMQQSISLGGCKFNPWPVATELTSMKQARGIAMLPAREEYVAESSCCCGHCAA